MTRTETILARIEQEREFQGYRDRVYKLRQIIGGDMSPIGGMGGGHEGFATPEHRAQNSSHGVREYSPIVENVTEIGRTNKIQRELRTLLLQTNFRAPEYEFPDLNPEEASFMSEYLRARMGPPPHGFDAMPAFQMAELDYLVGGMGFPGITLAYGYPAVSWFDSMDVIWDQATPSAANIEWVCMKERRPAYYWSGAFGEAKLREHFPNMVPDSIIELYFYYDLGGEKYGGRDEGTFAVFVGGGDNSGGVKPDPIHKEVNPFFYRDENTQEQTAFLPVEPLVFSLWPGVRYAEGLARGMLANQLAIWRGEAEEREIVEEGRPFRVIDIDAFDEDSLDEFLNGGGTMLKLKTGKRLADVLQQYPGQEIPDSVREYISRHDRELTGMSGVNAYASGAPIDDVKFASEVAAIQGASGVVAAKVARDMRQAHEGIAAKFIAASAIYEDRPISFRLDGRQFEFDNDVLPIRAFLRTDARPVVNEDGLQHASRAERLNMSASAIATLAPMFASYPALGSKLAERYLRDLGVRDIQGAMRQQPTMMPEEGQVQAGVA